MWNKIKTIIITVLATLGVLFIILMLIPDDEDHDIQEAQETLETQETIEPPETVTEEKPAEDIAEDLAVESIEDENTSPLPTEPLQDREDKEDKNTVIVSIPQSELSDNVLKFRTKTLDGKTVTQDIFSDYDITLVHVWGTFCGPCISEMGNYARFNESRPDNVNFIGIVCDVYEGIDENIVDANDILRDAGAKFTNLQTSDSINSIIKDIQYVPSSFFVDSEGHVIGTVLDGAGFDQIMEALNKYL